MKHRYQFREKTGRLVMELESETPLVFGDNQKEVEDTWQILVGQEVVDMHLPSMLGTQVQHILVEEEKNA